MLKSTLKDTYGNNMDTPVLLFALLNLTAVTVHLQIVTSSTNKCVPSNLPWNKYAQITNTQVTSQKISSSTTAHEPHMLGQSDRLLKYVQELWIMYSEAPGKKEHSVSHKVICFIDSSGL